LTNSNRFAGFLAEMKNAGLKVDEELICHVSSGDPAGGREGANYLFTLSELPTAVVCYNDFMALGVYNVIYEHGFHIPQDVSVAGFDNIIISGYLSPPLTTLNQFKFELGVGAANMMLDMLEKKQGAAAANLPLKISLKGTLCVRASTAPPSK
jgi:DNA-binding LacI/PurR family transcriptional regulator